MGGKKMKTLNQLRDEIHANAVKHGFYDFERSIPNGGLVEEAEHAFFAMRITLIHSELSEALEADRNEKSANLKAFDKAMLELKEENSFGNTEEATLFQKYIKNTIEDELADVIIRTLDLCGHLGIDIERHVELKMKYNELREYKHGKKY
jgi:NTP pyrophosphatase (non-canonical NTP hydrolase)